VSFTVGAVATLFLQHWFVGLLPGPTPTVTINGLNISTGNAAGCVSYSVLLMIDKPIDYSYVKIEVPNTIKDHVIALPDTQSIDQTRASIGAMSIGRRSGGECGIDPFASPTEEVQSTAAGNLLSFHTSELPRATVVEGLIVTNSYESSINPNPKEVIFEGEYKYTKLGIQITKKTPFVNQGMVDTKSPVNP